MVSVIIPTLNAADVLPALLESLCLSTSTNMEILVVDSSSDDNTTGIAEMQGVRVLTVARDDYDHGGTRTYAAQQAVGEHLVFLSQDVELVSPKAIEVLLCSFEIDSEIAAVYGRQLPRSDASVFASCLRLYNYPEYSGVRTLADKIHMGLKVAFLSNSFSAYRKKDLEQIGFFKESIIFGEDMYAASRLLLNNKKIAYCAEAKVYHSHNYSIRQDFQRYFDMGVFHASQENLLQEFGLPEKQGWPYIRFELRSIAAQHKYYLLPELFMRTIAKYAGYKIGKKCRFLPQWLNCHIGMNHRWWSAKNVSR